MHITSTIWMANEEKFTFEKKKKKSINKLLKCEQIYLYVPIHYCDSHISEINQNK